MPFDSNGTFNRVILGGWQADAAAGTKITAVRHDAEDDGFASGLSNCITKDGRTQPLSDIPMNGKKIINLGGPPTAPGDAANKAYVDNFKTFSTGITINGAGPINGFFNFTAPTGVNGIGWTTADMSWIGRLEEASKAIKRLAVNDKPDGTGNDVVVVDEAGRLECNVITSNMSYDGSTWRTIAAGKGLILGHGGQSGTFNLQTNDTATTVAYQAVVPRTFFSVVDAANGTFVTMNKEKSGDYCRITASMATKARWTMDFGNSTAESATGTDRAGSDFVVYSYDNAGTTAFQELVIDRSTHTATFGGQVTAGQNFASSTSVAVLGSTGAGAVYLRPNGVGSTAGQFTVDSAGNTTCNGQTYGGTGLKCRQGGSGGYGPNYHNTFFQSPYVYVYIDNTLMGAIAWQSDYRFKKDIKPLPSMWDRVKALSPIQYSIKDWGLFKNDDTPRWGFVAHELQNTLLKSAATGDKDAENEVQSPNPLTLIAVLTKALQEAMARIEVLEARP